jgi:hypothetical protein
MENREGAQQADGLAMNQARAGLGHSVAIPSADDEELVRAVEFAIFYVCSVFTTARPRGVKQDHKTRWAIWDRNLDTDDYMAIVFEGREVERDPDGNFADDLDEPYGEFYWKLRRAKARAAIRCVAQAIRSGNR